MIAWAAGIITITVLLLSAAGMHALMSFTIAQRTREIGIRSALGAQPRQLLLGVFGRAMRQLSIGLGCRFADLVRRVVSGGYRAGAGCGAAGDGGGGHHDRGGLRRAGAGAAKPPVADRRRVARRRLDRFCRDEVARAQRAGNCVGGMPSARAISRSFALMMRIVAWTHSQQLFLSGRQGFEPFIGIRVADPLRCGAGRPSSTGVFRSATIARSSVRSND